MKSTGRSRQKSWLSINDQLLTSKFSLSPPIDSIVSIVSRYEIQYEIMHAKVYSWDTFAVGSKNQKLWNENSSHSEKHICISEQKVFRKCFFLFIQPYFQPI